MARPDAVAPDGSEIYLLETTAGSASLVEVRLAAGQVSRPVRHRSVEEIWYVLAGEGRLWHEERVRPLRAGDVAVIRTGSGFQFAAERGELRFLCFTSPPWPGEEEAEKLPAGGLGPPTV